MIRIITRASASMFFRPSFLAVFALLWLASFGLAQQITPDQYRPQTQMERVEDSTFNHALKIRVHIEPDGGWSGGAMVIDTVDPGPATRLFEKYDATNKRWRRAVGALEPGDNVRKVWSGDTYPGESQEIRSKDDFDRAMARVSDRRSEILLLVRDVNTGQEFLWKTTAEKVDTYTVKIRGHIVPDGLKIDTVYSGPATRLAALAEFGRWRETPGAYLEPGDIIMKVYSGATYPGECQEIRAEDDLRRAMSRVSARRSEILLLVRDVNTGDKHLWKTTAGKVVSNKVVGHPARRVRVLVIGHTGVKGVGPSAEADVNGMLACLRGLPNFDPKKDLTMLVGDNIATQDVMRAVSRMQVEKVDAVLCYVAGHGAFDPRLAAGDLCGGHFFQLADGNLRRQDLLEALKARGGQLTVLLSDTCNVARWVNDRPQWTPEFGRGNDMTPSSKEDGRKPNAWHQLLLNHVGLVDVNGCSHRQFGWSVGQGGVFTQSWLRAKRTWNPVHEAGWEEFLHEVTQDTSAGFLALKDRLLDNLQVQLQIRLDIAGQRDQRPQVFTLDVRRVVPGEPAPWAPAWQQFSPPPPLGLILPPLPE